MATTHFAEGNYPAEFLVFEQEGLYSRDVGILAANQVLLAGTICGKKVISGVATATAGASNTGNGTMGTITVGAKAKAGEYILTITTAATNAGTFSVVDPDGVTLANGTVGVAYNQGGISFTLADGSTDFAASDTFVIGVSSVVEHWYQMSRTATTGEERAAGILLEDVDSTGAAVDAVFIVRDAIVRDSKLVWPTNATDAEKQGGIRHLGALGIQMAIEA